MAKQLVMASANAYKISEARVLLPGYEIIPYRELLGDVEIAETADTFEGNAQLKAEYVAKRTGRATISDDSGFCLVALGGFPGVRSHEFVDECGGSDEAFAELNRRLGDRDRSAYFVNVIALARPGLPTEFFRAEADGCFIYPPCGDEGFLYDYVFVPAGMELTYAECGQAMKDKISHRARGFRALAEFLKNAK